MFVHVRSSNVPMALVAAWVSVPMAVHSAQHYRVPAFFVCFICDLISRPLSPRRHDMTLLVPHVPQDAHAKSVAQSRTARKSSPSWAVFPLTVELRRWSSP